MFGHYIVCVVCLSCLWCLSYKNLAYFTLNGALDNTNKIWYVNAKLDLPYIHVVFLLLFTEQNKGIKRRAMDYMVQATSGDCEDSEYLGFV